MSLRYNEKARRADERRRVIFSTLRYNPLVAGAAGATCIVGSCVSLSNALVLIVLLAALLPLVALVSCSESERIKPVMRPAFYCFITALTVFLLSLLLDNVIAPGCVTALGIYAPLLAFDGLVLSRTAPDAPILTVRESMTEALTVLVCAAVIAIPVGIVRELLAEGTLFSVVYDANSPFRRPFFGFFLCAFVLAAFRAAAQRFIKEDA
ncbi:MAG: hypothetical protein E7546_06625 [Ruminococcaceae bacterium]|nr:hypothetical protein [Oscillospiraceae bacterium]